MNNHRSRTHAGSLLLLLISLVGAASFLYPFALPTLAGIGGQTSRPGIETSLLFTAIGVLCLILILTLIQERFDSGHGAAKMVVLLGVLVALDATLRLVPTVLGASPIFLLIILAGFSFGAEFGFLMGALTLLISALITGGLGPWLPYQMLGAGWIGLTAGWLPHSHNPGDRREIVMLAGFGLIWGLLYGAILNLMQWPYAAPGLQTEAGLYWTPDMHTLEILATYGRYYLATSLVYDSFRSAANLILIIALARPVLRLFHRYRTRFIWQPWRPYQPAASA